MTVPKNMPIEGVASEIEFEFCDMIDSHLSGAGMNRKIPSHIDQTQVGTFVVESEYEYCNMGMRYKEVLENTGLQIFEAVTTERNLTKTIQIKRSEEVAKTKQRSEDVSSKLLLDLSGADVIGCVLIKKPDWKTRLNDLKTELKFGPLSKDELQLGRLLVFELLKEYGIAFEEAESIERLLCVMKPGDE